jgi:hypothetical protein
MITPGFERLCNLETPTDRHLAVSILLMVTYVAGFLIYHLFLK